MTARTASRLAWSVWAMSLALGAAPFALDSLTGALDVVFAAIFVVIVLGFSTVGLMVASRHPGNAIGWIFLAVGTSWALSGLAQSYARYAVAMGRTSSILAEVADWSGQWVWIPAILLGPTLIALLFPDGHALSRRWRTAIWVAAAFTAVYVLTTAFAPDSLNEPVFLERNPFGLGIPRPAVEFAVGIGAAGILAAFGASIVSLVLRFRRSRGEERQQMKWLAFALVLAIVTMAGGFLVGGILGRGGDVLIAVNLFAVAFVPVAAGVAILKYRLYDIDLVINKTLVYGSLAAFITAVYVGVVVGIGSAFGRGDEPNLGLSILATAVVAVAFQPVRQRIQHLANRVVYGRRATPYEVLSRFSEGLAGTSGLEDLLSRLVRLLAEGTGAKNAQVWLRVSEQLVCEAAWPPDGEHPPPTPHRGDGDPVIPVAGRVVPVRHQGELLGAVALAKAPGDLITPGDDKLLADVASQAGLVLRNVRLVEELRASRQRIVAAQDEERRRLERDIHDGAQQELVALALGIRMAETRLGGATNPKLAEALERTDQELKETLSELRELARGIHPAILTERGLEPALRMLVERSPVPVDVESSLNSRLPPTVEATAYFVVAEALQNVAKYSGASVATVRVDASASELRVEVSDDGVGGADASRGSGLRGLMDRVAAVDGVLDVESAPGRGTRLTCRIPVRSRLQPRLMQGEASESVQGAEGESVGEPALR